MSAVYDPKTLLQIYHEAIDGTCSFLCINSMATDRSKTFMEKFDQYLVPG